MLNINSSAKIHHTTAYRKCQGPPNLIHLGKVKNQACKRPLTAITYYNKLYGIVLSRFNCNNLIYQTQCISMKHKETNEKSRSSGLYHVAAAQRQEEKGPRERSETTRENKDRHSTPREHTPASGGQSNPTATPGRSDSMEKERRSSRASFGGYQGL